MLDFRDEFLRLCSFPRSWGSEKWLLAVRGFYFSGVGQQITCAFCQASVNLRNIQIEEVREGHLSTDCMGGRLDGNLALGPVSDFKLERSRLCSYLMDRWPHPVDPNGLAAAGFYWTGYYDMVRCAFCGLEIKDWELGDSGDDAHQSFNPDCPFLKGLDVGNVLIAFRYQDESISRHLIIQQTKEVACQVDGEEDAVALAMRPAFPAFAAPGLRMRTFATWPKELQPGPEELSDAGFFYTGKGDRVVCFQCGGGLTEWQPTHSAWQEHALWFPTCTFVAVIKGKDFISKVHEDALAAAQSAGVEIIFDDGVYVLNETKLQEKSKNSQRASERDDVEEENKNDSSDMLCKVCKVSEIRAVTLPCGHMTTCPGCAPKLEICITCGKVASSFLVAFLS